jgi:hypothetical protein
VVGLDGLIGVAGRSPAVESNVMSYRAIAATLTAKGMPARPAPDARSVAGGEAAHAAHSARAAAGGEAALKHEPRTPDEPHRQAGAEAEATVCNQIVTVVEYYKVRLS